MSLVTISASFGAGGHAIAPEVADRLGVPFLDRAIPTEVARRLDLSDEHALAYDETASGPVSRLIAGMSSMGGLFGAASLDEGPVDDSSFQRETERVMCELADAGRGVILGRAGAIVLADRPALHVRLDGPAEARAAAVARTDGIELEEAERQRSSNDAARDAYVRHFYRRDATEAGLYQLVLDTTRLPWPLATELIVTATEGIDPD